MNEREKYEAIWGHDAYRAGSPGERRAEEMANNHRPWPLRNGRVLDAGCGSGRAAYLLAQAGFDVHPFDIAHNCMDKGPRIFFEKHGNPLTVGTVTALQWPDGFFSMYWSCDVLEHLPTEEVDAALSEAARVADRAWMEIALFPDSFGPSLLGEPLHLTVMGAGWWERKIRSLWAEVMREDCAHKVIFMCASPWRMSCLPKPIC